MKALSYAFIQVRISIAEYDSYGPLEILSLGIIFDRDRIVGSKSSFKLKKAGRALGMASNC